MIDSQIHEKPFIPKPANNRKMTLCRLKDFDRERKRVQSVPLFKDNGYGAKEFVGYRYIYHK
jgi:hypothetical protein